MFYSLESHFKRYELDIPQKNTYDLLFKSIVI